MPCDCRNRLCYIEYFILSDYFPLVIARYDPTNRYSGTPSKVSAIRIFGVRQPVQHTVHVFIRLPSTTFHFHQSVQSTEKRLCMPAIPRAAFANTRQPATSCGSSRY
jgi:hypothetical protein